MKRATVNSWWPRLCISLAMQYWIDGICFFHSNSVDYKRDISVKLKKTHTHTHEDEDAFGTNQTVGAETGSSKLNKVSKM